MRIQGTVVDRVDRTVGRNNARVSELLVRDPQGETRPIKVQMWPKNGDTVPGLDDEVEVVIEKVDGFNRDHWVVARAVTVIS